MEGEIARFRKKFFGGFNNDDVVAYIAELSRERNENIAARERAESKVQELQDEVARLTAAVAVSSAVPLSVPDPTPSSADPAPLPNNPAENKQQPTIATVEKKRIIVKYKKPKKWSDTL